jgi:cell division protease FtsH
LGCGDFERFEADAFYGGEDIVGGTGFTGADLANLLKEAAIVATRRKAEAVTIDDFTAAIERIVAEEPGARPGGTQPRRPSRNRPRAGRRDPAERRSGPRSVDHPRDVGALGYTMQRSDPGSLSTGSLGAGEPHRGAEGGRASEALVYDGEASTGLPMTCSARPRSQWRWSRATV